MAVSYTITPEQAGDRYDNFIVQSLPELSRAYIQRLIKEGRITLNGNAEKNGYKLRPGDAIFVDFDMAEIEQIADIDLPIIFEDEDVLVIDKPVGVISHSRGRYWNEPSVASFVRQKTGQPGDRAGIVHRLDRATSGVMICAKNQNALSVLQRQFSQRKVKKTYHAVVIGTPKAPEAIIDVPIERNPKAPSTFRPGSSGKSAVTKYKVLQSNGQLSLLELLPETGRTHQLRIHLQYIGHPIVGDTLYGIGEAERLFLHASSLEITLPNSERTTFVAPLPPAFNQMVR